MADYTGGDILEVTYNHPTEGSGSIFCKANEDGTIQQGGFVNNDDASQVTGNGTIINQKNRVRGRCELPPIAWDITSNNELEKLQKLQNSTLKSDWTISHASGNIWGGKGIPVGDIQGSTNVANVSLILAFDNDGPKKIS